MTRVAFRVASVLFAFAAASNLQGAAAGALPAEADAYLRKAGFTAAELAEIDRYATDSGLNIWAASSEN